MRNIYTRESRVQNLSREGHREMYTNNFFRSVVKPKRLGLHSVHVSKCISLVKVCLVVTCSSPIFRILPKFYIGTKSYSCAHRRRNQERDRGKAGMGAKAPLLLTKCRGRKYTPTRNQGLKLPYYSLCKNVKNKTCTNCP